MDEQEQARRALAESFRRERMEADSKAAQVRGKKRRELPRWVQEHTGLLVTLVVLAVLAIPVAFLVLRFVDDFGVADTIKQFCVATTGQRYSTAYSYLSRAARQRISRDAFETSAQHVVGCDLATKSVRADIEGDTARMSMVFFLRSGDFQDHQEVSIVTLVREDGSWRVDTVDASDLPFLPVAPNAGS